MKSLLPQMIIYFMKCIYQGNLHMATASRHLYLQFSTTFYAISIGLSREYRRLRSPTTRSSIFVVGLLSAALRTKFGERAFTRLRGTHWRRTYVLSLILDFLENHSRHSFFSLAICVCWQTAWDTVADNSDDCVMHLWVYDL